jgi:hypothetical protein
MIWTQRWRVASVNGVLTTAARRTAAVEGWAVEEAVCLPSAGELLRLEERIQRIAVAVSAGGQEGRQQLTARFSVKQGESKYLNFFSRLL